MLGGMLIQKPSRRAANTLQAGNFLAGIALTCLLAACALPLATYEGEPTLGPDELATVIAGTAAAAAVQTEAASTALPTPVPTQTPPIPTISAPPFSAEGTALVPNSDGSTTFIDQAAGYQLQVPAGWLLVRVNEREYLEARLLPEAADPKVQHFLDQVQQNDPSLFRLFGADVRPENLRGSFVSNFNILWDRSAAGSLEDMIGILRAELPGTFLDPEITFAEVVINSSRLPVGIVESSSTLLTPAGWPVYLYQKQVIYRLDRGILTIVLSTTQDVRDAYLPDFDAMVDGLVVPGRH